MDLNLKALREKAIAMAPIKEQERQRQKELNRQAEKHREQERITAKRNETIAEAQQLLRRALDHAAEEGRREAIVYCERAGWLCSKSYYGLFSHIHSLGCMREEYQEVHTLAQREGLDVRFLTKVHHLPGGGCKGGDHSDSCVSFYLSIRF
jgi:hypothetical protein